MSDITMCMGANCSKKEKCYRYTAKPNEMWQSYFMKLPFEREKGKFKCEYFMKNENKEINKQ